MCSVLWIRATFRCKRSSDCCCPRGIERCSYESHLFVCVGQASFQRCFAAIDDKISCSSVFRSVRAGSCAFQLHWLEQNLWVYPFGPPFPACRTPLLCTPCCLDTGKVLVFDSKCPWRCVYSDSSESCERCPAEHVVSRFIPLSGIPTVVPVLAASFGSLYGKRCIRQMG